VTSLTSLVPHMARRTRTHKTHPHWQNITVCLNLVLHNNKPWFQTSHSLEDDSLSVSNVYPLGYTPPFEVVPGETLQIQKDGGMVFQYTVRDGTCCSHVVVFPQETCEDVVH
jgi:hypothetical protein